MPKKELRPRSAVPFEVSTRRLAALHAQLSEWERALEGTDKHLDLLVNVREIQYNCLVAIVGLQQNTKSPARYKVACALMAKAPDSLEVTRAAEFGDVSVHVASNYLQSFVREGWAKRVRRGTYALKV